MADQVYVSSTRLVVRVHALPAFLRAVETVARELRRIDGFLGGAVLAEPRLAFWTLTAWDGPRSMRAFRDAGAHARVMPLLAEVGTEAAYVGWWQDEPTLPSWTQVHHRLVGDPTFTELTRPGRRQQAGRIPAPRFGISRRLTPTVPGQHRSLGSASA